MIVAHIDTKTGRLPARAGSRRVEVTARHHEGNVPLEL